MKRQLSALVFLAACSQSVPGLGLPANPNSLEVMQSTASHFPATTGVFNTGPAQNCQAGLIGQRHVQLCDFCVDAVIVQGEPLAYGVFLIRGIAVTQDRVRAAFARALSADQPDVEPANSSAGVWVVVGQLSEATNTHQTISPTPADLASAGFQVTSEPNTTYGGNYLRIFQGGQELSAQQFIVGMLHAPHPSSVFGLVPGCPNS